MNLRTLFLLCLLCYGCTSQTDNVVDLVNPLMGTFSTPDFSHGNVYPATGVPFGMTQWTPQTGEWGWIYQYGKDKFQGIRATHQPSPWIGDYGQFTLMPMMDTVVFDDKERATSFKHENEVSKPYSYKLTLDNGIHCEVTASSRSAILRFTFPKENGIVVFDASNAPGSIGFDAGSNTFAGWTQINSGGVPENFGLYFQGEVLGKVDTRFIPEEGTKSGNTTRGENVGLALSAVEGKQLVIRIGTSFISTAQAGHNLNRELADKSFEKLEQESKQAWEKELSKIRIESDDTEKKRTFYSSLYRTMIFPREFHEFNGDQMIHYSPYDGKVHEGPMYVDNGFWDTFRGQFPLVSIIHRKRHSEMLEGFVNSYKEGDWLPKWTSPGYRNSMIGTHSASLIADAYLKGIRDFDYQAGYEAMVKDAMEDSPFGGVGREGIAEYMKKGYIPSDVVHEATSRTLEFAYDDFCVGQMAAALGMEEESKYFLNRSFNYKNVFDESTGFMRGRLDNGEWEPDFSSIRWGGAFTEGSAWHYSWSVLHDPAGLVALMGGKEAFEQKMDAVFETPPEFDVGGYGREIHEMTEMVAGNMGQYAHGNQPVHHFVYLYNYIGKSWKTQQHVREILSQLYNPTPAGFCGDEDNGQMSAWYVLSALGFYQVTPGTDQFIVGSPLFEMAKIDLGNGKDLMIDAPYTESQPYVRKLTLNDQVLNRRWLTYNEIMGGGTLKFEMGSEPLKDPEYELPASLSDYYEITQVDHVPTPKPTVSAPVFSHSHTHFSQPFQLSISLQPPESKIYYSLDSSAPDETSTIYNGPIEVSGSIIVKSRAYKEGFYKSPMAETRYIHVDPKFDVTLANAPAKRYSAGSPLALVDGVMGSRNYFDSAWMGFSGVDMDATIDLGEAREVSHVAPRFLEQQGAWILFPRKVSVWTSTDGESFEMAGRVTHTIQKSDGLIIEPFAIKFKSRQARFIRIQAENIGVLPEWHPAAGGNAYLFVDEIEFR